MRRKPETERDDRLKARNQELRSAKYVRLTVAYGPGLSFEPYSATLLPDVKVFTIGREPGAPGLELHDPKASRRHAVLELVSGAQQFRLTPQSAVNGTFLNGAALQEPDYLSDGAVIRMGDTLVVYEEIENVPGFVDLSACPSTRGLGAHVAHEMALKAKDSKLSALIIGPTGAGKEVLARAVHDSDRPFVAINCATLSKELASAELFGHVKGAFDNAHKDRPGLFAAAEDGTIFLDEIGELPMEVQPMLLRALQEKRRRPVGSDREHPFHARVLAATHQPLTEFESDGRFRSDLLARLSAIELNLPGLAARRVEVLPLLSMFFARSGMPITVTPDAAEALLVYEWPKNIRELELLVERIKLMDSPKLVDVGLAQLPAALRPSNSASTEPGGGGGRPSKERLVELLTLHGGNVSGVARELEAFRTQVNRWLELYNLEPSRFRAPKKGPGT